MKLNQLAVIVSNKKGDVYEVCLTKDESLMITSFIEQMQDGRIKLKKEKLETISLI